MGHIPFGPVRNGTDCPLYWFYPILYAPDTRWVARDMQEQNINWELEVSVRRSLIERLSSRMKDRGINRRQLSIKAGLGQTYINDLLSNKVKAPSVTALKAIATELDCDVAYLLGDQEKPRVQSDLNVRLSQILVAGVAEAGAFRSLKASPAEAEYQMAPVNAALSTSYPAAKHFAFAIRGSSMNAARPVPILEGMLVLCVDLVDANLELESGQIYVVRRTIDGGQTYEFTVKRAVIFKDRMELRPESSDQSHRPIILRYDAEPDPAVEVLAVGWVYGLYTSLETHA
jgi:transcriptional regulator with XRE-family HTH domain